MFYILKIYMKLKNTLFGKMILLSGFIQLVMLVIVIFAMYAFHLNEKKHNYMELEGLLIEASNKRLEMLSRRDTNFKNLFYSNIQTILNNLEKYDTISQKLKQNGDKKKLDSLKNIYRKNILIYEKLFEKFGLDENSGVEGDFRKKIHKLESFLKSINNNYLLALTLQARRREKDYIMRKRDEYVQNVIDIVNKIKSDLKYLNLPQDDKDKMYVLADEYLKSFQEFVKINKEMRNIEIKMNDLEKNMIIQINLIVKKATDESNSYQSIIVPLFVISIIFSLVISIFFARSITNPLVRLKQATIKLASGDYRIKVKVESEDEIGDLANFFNKMVENISAANETIMNQQQKLHAQYNELKEINAMKDKFFSIIAHDLKNPMSAFMGVSSFLAQTFHELSQEELKEFLDDVNNSAKQLYELLENLLMWSRSQRGLIHYHPANQNLRQILNNNIDLIKMNADNKKISLSYDIDGDYEVYADANMLNTIIRNLCTNAIKFTHEGGSVKIICRNNNDGFCQISVKDTGVGIPEENLKNLFNLQNSISTTGTKQESGTGLGLILCHEFVQRHGGKIWVESTVGVGTTFHFTIPLANKDILIGAKQNEN